MLRNTRIVLRFLLTFLCVAVVTGNRASAATETILHSFNLTPHGLQPNGSLISDPAGNLYGTTSGGGTSGSGIVFEITP
jgi:uncharacterized repeat protein (TIGR03803 family)